MSTVATEIKIAMLDAALARINLGSTDATGDINFRNAANSSLAVLTFSTTAFAAAADVAGTIKAAANAITASGTPTIDTIANAQIRNRNNTALWTFTVGTSGAEMNVGAVVIPVGTTSVGLTSFEMSLSAS